MPRPHRFSTNSFVRDSVVRSSFLLSFGLLLTSTLTLIYYYHRLPPVVPIFYSLVRGPEQLAKKPFLLALPLATLIFLITHIWLARIHSQSDRMFARILAVTSTLISFLFTIALFHVLIIIL